VAGLTAGSEVNQSNTYHVIPNAVEIVGLKTDSEIETALKAGKMVISPRSDGAIVIEQDINTLHTFTTEKPYSFSKNRVIRTLDGVNNDIALMFQKGYLGKVSNNEDGRNLFKASVIGYLNTLQGLSAIQDFDSATDVIISAGEAIDSVVADLAIQPVDSMEKVYMTVLVS
jgi:microsomal dipeptidase-like Zn-dependent dipeptidase